MKSNTLIVLHLDNATSAPKAVLGINFSTYLVKQISFYTICNDLFKVHTTFFFKQFIVFFGWVLLRVNWDVKMTTFCLNRRKRFLFEPEECSWAEIALHVFFFRMCVYEKRRNRSESTSTVYLAPLCSQRSLISETLKWYLSWTFAHQPTMLVMEGKMLRLCCYILYYHHFHIIHPTSLQRVTW